MLSVLRNKHSGRIYRNFGVIQVFNEGTSNEDMYQKVLSHKEDWQKEYVYLRDQDGSNVVDKPFTEADNP